MISTKDIKLKFSPLSIGGSRFHGGCGHFPAHANRPGLCAFYVWLYRQTQGGQVYADRIQAIVHAGIPVMGHLGLLPQSVLKEGGYRVQGRTDRQINQLEADAVAVERAGVFACVLEYVVTKVARRLSEKMQVPTIGIGAGNGCDGQVLVTSDLLGQQSWLNPKAARRYANVGEIMKKAFLQYAKDVRTGKFPSAKESFE